MHSKASTEYTVEFYTAIPDASGFGEGRSLLLTTTVTTDDRGNGSFFLNGLNLTPGSFVTSLARETSFTSEFSAAHIVAPSDTGDFTLSPSAISVSENSGTVTITDNDAAPVASINGAGTVEGHIGSTPFTFTVPSAFPVNVNWVTFDVSASHTIDYSGGGGDPEM